MNSALPDYVAVTWNTIGPSGGDVKPALSQREKRDAVAERRSEGLLHRYRPQPLTVPVHATEEARQSELVILSPHATYHRGLLQACQAFFREFPEEIRLPATSCPLAPRATEVRRNVEEVVDGDPEFH